MENMKNQLIDLLNIHSVSGKEAVVREYLTPILSELVDVVTVDSYGNLLGEKKCGSGEGSTILLSAHMDTVKGVLYDKKLIERDGIITSDKGALGADDRAGIAIILTVLRNVEKLDFDGIIRVAFSKEEEIGCVGAEKIDFDWYEGTDLAIVVDRRGNRDIVVGCGTAFCSDSVGLFMENASKMVDMDWKCVEGGVSDALVFAEQGINSINLSAGYINEHTDREFVVLDDMRSTVRLILQTIAIINQFSSTFKEVENENKWVKCWRNETYNENYYEDLFQEDIYAEQIDDNGDILIYEIGTDIVIQQGENEICLSRSSFANLMDQLKGA